MCERDHERDNRGSGGGRLWQSEKRTADRSPTCQAQVRSLHRGGSRRRSASTASRAVAGCDQQQDDTQEFSCSGGISLASTRAEKKEKNCSANYFRFPLDTVLLMMDRSLIRPEAPLPPHRSYFVMTLRPDKFFLCPR